MGWSDQAGQTVTSLTDVEVDPNLMATGDPALSVVSRERFPAHLAPGDAFIARADERHPATLVRLGTHCAYVRVDWSTQL